MPKQPKPKALKLSKEQIAARMRAESEAIRLRTIARESIFPALQDTKDLFHAQQVCEVLKTVITQAQNNHWTDKVLGDLGLIEELKGEAEATDKEVYIELLEKLADVSIADAHKLIEGMGSALSGYTAKIAHQTKISDLAAIDIIEG